MLYRSAMFQFPVERGIEWSSLTCHAVLLLGKADKESYSTKYNISLGNIPIYGIVHGMRMYLGEGQLYVHGQRLLDESFSPYFRLKSFLFFLLLELSSTTLVLSSQGTFICFVCRSSQGNRSTPKPLLDDYLLLRKTNDTVVGMHAVDPGRQIPRPTLFRGVNGYG